MSESIDLPSYYVCTITHSMDASQLIHNFIVCELSGYFRYPYHSTKLLHPFFFFRVTLAFIGISFLVIGTTMVGQLPDSR